MLEVVSGTAFPGAPAPPPSRQGSVRLSGRVLIAEDVEVNQKLIARHLVKAGAKVETANNGRVAVDKALDAKDAGQPYDLILMDMQMPELDGYGATAELRRKGYTGPIVALTAHAMSSDREKCLNAGCNDFLSKPIEHDELLSAAARCLEHRNIEAEAADSALTGRPTLEPLVSELGEDPEMAEIIDQFKAWLPDQVVALRGAMEKLDHPTLRQVAHGIKGTAGSCGFGSLAKAAATVEAQAKAQAESDTLTQSIRELVELCDRMKPAFQHEK